MKDMLNNFQPGYYATITAEVRYDNRLTANAKLLYAEITALTNFNGACFASNRYFSKLYNVSIRTVNNWIEQLEEYGYIERVTDSKNQRYIILKNSKENSQLSTELSSDKNTPPHEKNFMPPMKKISCNNIKGLIKEEINIDKLDKGENHPPINNHYLTSLFLKNKIFNLLDLDIKKFNNLFTELDSIYPYELVLESTRYLIPIIKKNIKSINSVFAYFKYSITEYLKNYDFEEAEKQESYLEHFIRVNDYKDSVMSLGNKYK